MKSQMTLLLEEQLHKHIAPHNDTRIYWAKEVTFDYYSTDPIRVDFMKIVPLNQTISGLEKSEVYCYEIKSSVGDFHSKHGHNFIGDFNYYVMPLEIFEKVKEEIPYNIGCYCYDGTNFELKKKAQRHSRTRSTLEIVFMMFRSFRRDELRSI